MRCFVECDPPEHRDDVSTPPFQTNEWDRSKIRAKALCRLWRSENGVRAAPPSAAGDAVVHAVRFEMRGDSLRGLEHITDANIGRKRRRVQGEAIRAAVVEQQEQLVQHVLHVAHSAGEDGAEAEDRARAGATRMDAARLAAAYGPRTRGALNYARRVAQEDAQIAAEILAEDLRVGTRQASFAAACELIAAGSPPVGSYAGAAGLLTAGPPVLTDEFINSFFPAMLSCHQRVAYASMISTSS